MLLRLLNLSDKSPHFCSDLVLMLNVLSTFLCDHKYNKVYYYGTNIRQKSCDLSG